MMEKLIDQATPVGGVKGLYQLARRAALAQNSELAAMFKMMEEPGIISFSGGFPDPKWYLDEVKAIEAEVMSKKKDEALSYGPTPGLTLFREYLAERLSQQGIPTKLENIIITHGSLQGLDLICRIFLDKGDSVVIEAPTYIGAILTMQPYEVNLVGVPVDGDGMQIDALEETLLELKSQRVTPKFIYTIPSFQNPTGTMMSLPRRQKLVEISQRFGVPVVEDHAYGELKFDGDLLPTLAELGGIEHIIHLGTLSKIFSPGIRLGWLVAHPSIVEKAIFFKQGMDQCCNSLGQLLALEYGRRGLIEKQIAVTRNALKQKASVTLENIEKLMPKGTTYTVPQGGFYTWVSVPGSFDSVKMLEPAVKRFKVAYVAGPSFYHDRRGPNQMRICYSLPDPAVIPEGISRLASVVKAWEN